MGRFDQKKLKNNFTSLLIMGLAIVVLVAVESLISPKEEKIEGLGNGEVQYNQLVINEMMTSNKGSYADSEGNCYDWIELYNGTNQDIDLSGYGLSDEVSGNTKWIFPAVTIKSKSYLVIYLSGQTKEGLYANFALNKAGSETITLKRKSGKVVDTVKTVSLDKNTVMARSNDGSWIKTDEITPGYANNEEGRKAYLDSRVATDSLVISEFLPSNEGNVSFDGHLYSYLEVMNTGEKEVSLRDYFVSNDSNRPFLYRLPDVTLKPNEVYLVYTSGLGKDNHADFTLKKKTGTVILAKKDKIVDSVDYQDLTNGFAYIKTSKGFQEAIDITPGYPNTPEGMAKFSSEKRKNPTDLIISEVMSSNHEYLAQNGGEYYDWIELYNNTDHAITLSDYSLTTNDSNPSMYQLPNVTLKSKEYYVVMASGNTSYSNSKYQHTNFKISPVESIYLYKGNAMVDSLFLANIPNGYSFGRGEQDGFYYFKKPTPVSKNEKSTIQEIAYEPIFQEAPGIYNDVNELAVTLEGSGTIYYTLDGSTPTKNSKVYDSPILLKKTTVIKAVSYENKKKESSVVTGSYIINEKHTLPVLSVSLPATSFQYLNLHPSDMDLVMPAHAELYEEGKSFSIDCGLKLFGGQTRYISKKSYALKFSKEFGPSTLEYKVFDNRDAVSYDTLVVRSGSQDSVGTMIRDELATSIMDDYGTVDVQAYKATILYVNGEYWGVYFLREKVNEEFISHHYDVKEEGTNIVRIDNNVTAGTASDYRSLVNYVKSHNLSVASNYEYVASKLDIDNFIDYWVGELFTTNNDIVNTRFFNHPDVNGGKIKMIFYDFDYAFYFYNKNYMQWMTAAEGMGEHFYDNTLLRGLLQNSTFKKRFLERLSWNMKNVWTEENVLGRYQELVDLLKPEMERNQKRWGMTYQEWLDNLAELKTYLQKRRTYLINHTKSYFHLSSEEVNKYFG